MDWRIAIEEMKREYVIRLLVSWPRLKIQNQNRRSSKGEHTILLREGA